MCDELRVLDLLEEALQSGRSPEDVCAGCPEVLEEVRERLARFAQVRDELDAMFPEQRSIDTNSIAVPGQGHLPRIPGHEVEAVLGRGGMGIVYKAWDLRLNRPVAVKMMLAGGYAGPPEMARFLREAETMARLGHPNVVQVYDVGDIGGLPYFTMEYVEGGNLAEKLTGVPQPARQAAALVAVLAEAVEAAHRRGIVHRDLKPANVLLTGEGTPKISDFGLARWSEPWMGMTWTGARIGTPSYMAPEQAAGQVGTIGPTTDVYALGAVLYEMVTGRPPFRAETAVETERQVISEEPASPSRLNARVPRGLETICLKCLRKSPKKRYATASALAEELHRFLRGEPIEARPVGLPERTARWVLRRPTQSTILAASLVLAILLVSGGLWLTVQTANRRHAVEADLQEVEWLQESARWPEARAALERAKSLLEGGGPHDLYRRVGQARSDLDLVMMLDTIRLKRVTRGELAFYKGQANRDYEGAFQQAGLGTIDDQPARVAVLINGSAVREALLAAVYDWAVCAPDKAKRGWLMDVARLTDPNSDSWHQRVLDRTAWDDPPSLAELARTAPGNQSVSLLLALGERLRTTGGDVAPFLKRVQKEHPADFWANMILGNAMLQGAPGEAAGYYRAALASRPAEAVGYCAVGDALRLLRWQDEAIDYYEKAIRVDPGYARAYSNLGLAFLSHGRVDEAIDHCRKALELDPDYAWAHQNLANALRVKGRLDEAFGHYQQVIRLDPKNTCAADGIRSLLMRQGRLLELQVDWRKALDANPPDHSVWQGYAELCLFLEQPEEYRRTRRALLDRFGAAGDPYIAEPVGRACLLLPAAGDELRKATVLTDRAVAAKASTPEWIYRYFLFAKGLAEYRQGRFEAAVSLMEGEASNVLGPCPRLVMAMARHRQGRGKLARQTLAEAIITFDWSAAQADNRDVLMCHVLRREAEAMILPNLPAFLRGDYQPSDNDERLALVGICQFQGRCHAAARLYAEAFATDPAPAEALTSACRSRATLGDKEPVGRVEELATVCRYPASRCAALAGCGLGKDGARLGEADRSCWRKQACEWLRDDLAVWSRTLDSSSRASCDVVTRLLTHWQTDPDLAGLREPSALDKLSGEEREACLALWKEVAALLNRAKKAR